MVTLGYEAPCHQHFEGIFRFVAWHNAVRIDPKILGMKAPRNSRIETQQ